VPGGFGGSVNKLKLRREFGDGVELAGVVANGLCIYVLVKDIGRVVLPGLLHGVVVLPGSYIRYTSKSFRLLDSSERVVGDDLSQSPKYVRL